MELKLGSIIRTERKNQKLSIEQLSEKTGLSTGLISQLERDITGPSVDSLWRIAQALDISIGYFFGEAVVSDPVVKSDKRKKLQVSQSNVTYELLSPSLQNNIEMLLIKIEPGECNTEELICHEGEECGFVLQGTLKIKWGINEYILEEGDSIYLDSTIPHRYVNIGDCTCVSVWSMVPPSF